MKRPKYFENFDQIVKITNLVNNVISGKILECSCSYLVNLETVQFLVINSDHFAEIDLILRHLIDLNRSIRTLKNSNQNLHKCLSTVIHARAFNLAYSYLVNLYQYFYVVNQIRVTEIDQIVHFLADYKKPFENFHSNVDSIYKETLPVPYIVNIGTYLYHLLGNVEMCHVLFQVFSLDEQATLTYRERHIKACSTYNSSSIMAHLTLMHAERTELRSAPLTKLEAKMRNFQKTFMEYFRYSLKNG